jgi:hypothetical protein
MVRNNIMQTQNGDAMKRSDAEWGQTAMTGIPLNQQTKHSTGEALDEWSLI